MKINLFKENVLEGESDFSRGKILEYVSMILREYKKYIENSRQVVQKQGAIKIGVSKLKIQAGDDVPKFVWKVNLDSLKDKEAERAEYELFGKEIQSIYLELPNSNSKRIYISSRNAEEKYLILKVEDNDDIKEIFLKADDSQLRKQLDAVNKLLFSPNIYNEPILQLFNRSDYASSYFKNNIDTSVNFSAIDWKVLTDNKRDGINQQRSFVYKALRTSDFALLEGPPGSGKTTAIIELILQLIEQGKRVLLVSATHVAVDNVIHRILTTYKNQCEGKVVPLRIGDKDNIRQESVEPYILDTFIKKKKEEIKNNLGKKKNRTESQERLYNHLKNPLAKHEEFDDIILKSANLIGGTMIGVLQHPDIKKPSSDELFDVMIVDESSKVTFLDFIVPALYAKKWILVGDVRQLSPYIEGDYINESIDELIASEIDKKDIVHQFRLKRDIARNQDDNYLRVILTDDVKNPFFDNLELSEIFRLDNKFTPTQENIWMLNGADIIVCQNSDVAKNHLARYVFVKTKVFEGYIDAPNFKNRQKFLHQDHDKKSYDKFYHPFEFDEKKEEWKELVGSFLGQYYEYRFNPHLAQNIKKDLDLLIPNEACRESLDNLRKVALPSILELLQIGIGETRSTKGNVQNRIIYEGFKNHHAVIDLKFESLEYQHRMNDDIAQTSRKYFYESKNLLTANAVVKRTNPLKNYKSGEADVIWVANGDKTFQKKDKNGNTKNINPTEKEDIKKELQDFIQFAKLNPKKNEKGDVEDYEVAVLSFYRQQEFELKNMLRGLTGQQFKNKFFSIDNIKITLCTVDKFQGDEADLVLLSFAIFTPKAFYNNSNRLNVALTRARYKLVLFGNKSWLGRRAISDALKYLANEFEARIISKNK